jgi:hypothetical protein
MAKSGPKSLKEKDQDLNFRRYSKALESLTSLGSMLIRYGSVVCCFYFMYRTASVLAGRTTVADIGLKMLGSLSITSAVGYALGTAGTIYGLRERKLRRDKTEYLQDRVQKYEKRLDPKRTSSRLTPRGTTNPQDRE